MSDVTQEPTTPSEGQGAAQTATAQDATLLTGQTASTETTDGGAKEGAPDGGKTEATDAKTAAPESYEFKDAEGKVLDGETFKGFAEIAKGLNLPQEAAQKVLDAVAPALEQRMVAQLVDQRSKWADEARADKEIGGDKLTESLAGAKAVLAKFGDESLTRLLEESGLGNRADVIRFFAKVSKAVLPDNHVVGGGAAAAVKAAKPFYDTMARQMAGKQ